MSRPAYLSKPTKKHAPTGPAKRQAEREKRAQMRAELERQLAAPLNPEAKLSKREREKIAERVRTGICRQSFHAMNGGSNSKTVQP